MREKQPRFKRLIEAALEANTSTGFRCWRCARVFQIPVEKLRKYAANNFWIDDLFCSQCDEAYERLKKERASAFEERIRNAKRSANLFVGKEET